MTVQLPTELVELSKV